MTKQHIALADAIRDHNKMSESIGQRPFDKNHIDLLAGFLMQHNPRFNPDRWLDYINKPTESK
jgi:hypothetical protein